MKKILFLGSNSFTGLHFKDFIKRKRLYEEFSFFGADQHERDKDGSGVLEYRKVNLSDKVELENLLSDIRPDYIVNLIGSFSANSHEEYLKVNTDITRYIFECITKIGLNIKNFLVIGSSAEYGSGFELPAREDSSTYPVNLYGLSKLMQTDISRYFHNNYGIKMNVARTFNIIGKGISNRLSVGNFIEQIERAQDGDTLVVGNLETKRDYLHIEDVIEAYWEILKNGRPGEVYNVCSGKSYSMESILKSLIEKSGKLLNIVTDKRFLKLNDIMEIYGDNSKLISHTHWHPTKDFLKD